MLSLFPVVLSLTYFEWFFRTHEFEAIYPFDVHYVPPANARVPGLREDRVRAADTTELLLWRIDAQPGRPTVLYLPGNAGNLLGRAQRFRDLAERGYGVIALSWRGQGGAPGSPEEAVLCADALRVYDLFAALDPVVWGESLGTAPAARIAALRDLRGLVLESPFTSMTDLAGVQYPRENLAGLVTQRWETLPVMPRVDDRLLVLHGSGDRLVPRAQAEAVFAAAGSSDKTMARIEGKGHDGLWTAEGQNALYGFLDRL